MSSERFVEAVARQTGRERDEVSAILAACSKEGLAGDPAMLSSFFQNADLLYEDGYWDADAVGMLIVEAVHLASGDDPA